MQTSPRVLPMLPVVQVRPVDPEWSCQHSGDCCSIPKEVIMTREERTALLPHVPVGLKSEWRDINDQFVALKAHPCPFYVFKTCLVYAVRPYNCRRFACMRPDPKTEPFEEMNNSIGCKNLYDRIVTSRPARRLAVKIQRKAQRWAVSHGWGS